MASSLESAQVALHYLYPAAVFLYYIIASIVSVCSLQGIKKADKTKTKRPGLLPVCCLYGLFLVTYLVQLVAVGILSIRSREWPTQDHIIIGHLSCILVFGIQLSQLLDAENLTSYPFVGSWALSLAFEIALVALSASPAMFKTLRIYGIIDLVMISVRCITLILLIGLFTLSFETMDKAATDEERQSLLPKTTATSGTSAGESQNGEAAGYGSTTQAEQTTEESAEETPEYNWERREREAKEAMQKRLEEGGNWFEYAKGFKVSLLFDLVRS